MTYSYVQYQVYVEPIFSGPEEVDESKWHQPWSSPQKLTKKGLGPHLEAPFLALFPLPVVSFGWFEELSKPARLAKPGLASPLQQFTAFQPNLKLRIEWFAPLSEPVRIRPALKAALQQYLAQAPRLLPTPSIIGVLNALETNDGFLGGARAWNRVVSGEIGVIESAFTGADIGIVEQAAPVGASGLIEAAVAGATGSPVTVIAGGRVGIRII